jgi:hypothetical protein
MPFGNPQRKTYKVLINENPSKYLKTYSLSRIHFKITFENKVQL